jgi:predicted metal-dependent hydrolase
MTANSGAVARAKPYLREVKRSVLRERAPRPFALDGRTLDVRVRESDRARTTRIIVGPRRPLEVIVPAGTDDASIDDFLQQKRRWVETKVQQAEAIAARPPQLGLVRPGVVWLEGEAVPVERRAGVRSIASLRDGRLVVTGPASGIAGAIERWYRREARRRVEEVLTKEAPGLQLRYSSLGIRDPRTRWGSCSRRGHLSFSWRLALAPRHVLEYVVVHELCHLKEPSHAKSFWRLLDAARPGWHDQALWLREHGQELHDYRPAVALGL